MKKQKLAAASLLLALLIPMAATPLVYADSDSEGAPPTEPYVASEPAESSNDDSIPVSDGKAIVKHNDGTFSDEFGTLDEAMKVAVSGETIYLGAGTYCGNTANPTKEGPGAGKSLTFVGAGTGETIWEIRALETPSVPGDGPCDYSFRGSESITFENMTVVGSVYYNEITKTKYNAANATQGLTFINNITLKNCVFNGRADYWGYETTTFENVTFNAPGTEASGIAGIDKTDYSLWTYTGNTYTFTGCTFNSTGKTINVYRHGDPGYDVTVNFESCTVNNTAHKKQAMKINDSTMGSHKYNINISGDNVVNGIDANAITCSRLFGFDADVENTRKTIVKIQGTTVWENGQRAVDHNGNNFSSGSYIIDGNENDSANQYTDGYKDNAFTIKNTTPWVLKDGTNNTYVRAITKTCNYCGDEVYEQEVTTGYCLSYDLNGGTGTEGAYNDTYYSPTGKDTAIVAAAPSRAGYVFTGWQDANSNWYAAGDTVTVDQKNITLTAQWNKLVTVDFDLCGHGGTNVSSQTFVSGSKATEPAALKEDGWVFGGWYTERGCQNLFNFDTAITSDMTLYAKWTRTAVAVPTATPTPTPAPATATTAKTVKTSTIPQTSDAFPIEGLLALLAVGAVGTGAMVYLRKKHH